MNSLLGGIRDLRRWRMNKKAARRAIATMKSTPMTIPAIAPAARVRWLGESVFVVLVVAKGDGGVKGRVGGGEGEDEGEDGVSDELVNGPGPKVEVMEVNTAGGCESDSLGVDAWPGAEFVAIAIGGSLVPVGGSPGGSLEGLASEVVPVKEAELGMLSASLPVELGEAYEPVGGCELGRGG